MSGHFELDLTPELRGAMLAELQTDVGLGGPYLSPRLNELGRVSYPHLLRDALREGSPETLSFAIQRGDFLNSVEPGPRGGLKRVPSNASDVIAGEFLRYHARAVCLDALAQRVRVVAYRARASSNPRPESEAMIGRELDPSELLLQLRASRSNPSVNIPAVGSGLAVRLM